jgi:hypothetical protein
MKITKTILLAFLITLINVSSVLAVGTPPSPGSGSTSKTTAVPPPPDTPINESLVLLLICGLSFGIHTIYRYNLNKKASM